MSAHTIAHARCQWLVSWATLVALAAPAAWAQPMCSSGCMFDTCTQLYGAQGIVRDDVTNDPIAGARIVVFDLEGVSAIDGAYHVSGSRPARCQFDYLFSMAVSAPGYETFAQEAYFTSAYSGNLEVRLTPLATSTGVTISGVVTEFPNCLGRMRGVDVVLEPLGLTAQTSIDANSGGTFEFTDVPSGDYTLRVVQGCNPYGCWQVTPVHVGDNDVNANVCLGGPAPPTPTSCPVETPCILGERPRPCSMTPCGLGCGCESCPPCPDGSVLAPHYNRCDCEFTSGSPTPTPTPDRCHFSTPPLCSVGEEIDCAPGQCPEDCHCTACAPCPDGLVYSGIPNQCQCVDPSQFTLTPTPTPTPTGPTPTVCPRRSRCPDGQHPAPCGERCGLGCGCEGTRVATRTPTPAGCPLQTPPVCPVGKTPDCAHASCITPCDCNPCPDCPGGLVYSGKLNYCDCVDPRTASARPSVTPSATPTPTHLGTPAFCPTATPPQCTSDEALSCDVREGPCTLCRCAPCAPCAPGFERENGTSSCGCVATAEPPQTRDEVNMDGSGGCGIVAAHESSTMLWLWSLALVALIRARRLRR